jgi:protein-S-isoprenylcysteine O-methyltransferase Ste14
MKVLKEKLFSFRSYTPVPFLLVMIIFAQPTAMTMTAGFMMVLLGESMRLWGVAYAGSLTRVTGSVGAPEIIMAGPFGHVRNPLYVGNILTYVGIGVMSNALFPWLVLVAAAWFVFQYDQIVSLEEEFLGKEFGDSYHDFTNNVPRFFPRLSPYVHLAQLKQLPNWNEALRSERRTFQALGLVMAILIVLWYMR